MLRGRNEHLLRLSLKTAGELEDPPRPSPCEAMVAGHFGIADKGRAADKWLLETARWAWMVKLSLHLELELMKQLRETAEEEAIRVFARNLHDLLLPAQGPYVHAFIGGGLRRHQHQLSVTPGKVGTAPKEAVSMAGGLGRVREKCEIMDGHDKWGRGGWHRYSCGVNHIEWASCLFDLRPSQHMPGLIERQPGQREFFHRDRRCQSVWGASMTRAHPNELQLGVIAKGQQGAVHRGCGYAGNHWPLLLHSPDNSQVVGIGRFSHVEILPAKLRS